MLVYKSFFKNPNAVVGYAKSTLIFLQPTFAHTRDVKLCTLHKNHTMFQRYSLIFVNSFMYFRPKLKIYFSSICHIKIIAQNIVKTHEQIVRVAPKGKNNRAPGDFYPLVPPPERPR